MIKKVISLGLVLMMVLVVVGGVYGSYEPTGAGSSRPDPYYFNRVRGSWIDDPRDEGWIVELTEPTKKGLNFDLDNDGDYDIRWYFQNINGMERPYRIDVPDSENIEGLTDLDGLERIGNTNIFSVDLNLNKDEKKVLDESLIKLLESKTKGSDPYEGPAPPDFDPEKTISEGSSPSDNTKKPSFDPERNDEMLIIQGNIPELLENARTAEINGNYERALKFWKEIEEKLANTDNRDLKQVADRAKENIESLQIKIKKEQERRQQEGVVRTANIMKGRLWGVLNKFFGDYSFGIPSKMCQAIFDTTPVDDGSLFSVRDPEDYKFKNNVATVQGYKSDYSYEEKKRYVYEVSYSLYAGKENLAYGVFFSNTNEFIEEGEVNLGDVKRGYFVKESEEEYKSVCVKYSSGSICGSFKEG